MFWLTSIFELFSMSKKLKASKAHVMSAVSSLIIVMFLGIFAAILAALMTGGLLVAGFNQMQTSGLSLWASLSITAAFTIIIIGFIFVAVLRLWRNMRADIEQIMHSQAPIIAPVVDKVSDIATSFMSGLRSSRDLKPKVRSKKSLG